jgi:hypothetical protein
MILYVVILVYTANYVRRSKMPPQKRPASELSSNENTARARRRRTLIDQDPVNSRVEKAKAADQAAKTYAMKRLRDTPAYQAASLVDRQTMEDTCARDVQNKR